LIGVAGTARSLEYPFPVSDPFFAPPQINLHGSVEDSLQTESGAPMRLDENFHAGLESWQGGIRDWKVDVAGVRTGSLALFSPSLGLRDYSLEFLAKIEHRSVGWVFRAADLTNYFAARIVAADRDGSSAELIRYAVVDGVRGPAFTKALVGRVRSRAAFTVQMTLDANEFHVAIDGETIDHWTDDRLPAGGIGFLADGEDRARLYWVRLCSPPNRSVAVAQETSIGV
jgi:hypothetical protein